MERRDGIRRGVGVMLGLWDELTAGTLGDDTPVGVSIARTESAEPPDM